MTSLKTDLITLALESRKYAYSPYSKKKIGAAIKLSNGKIYSGCNIENASYGGTVCAERVAIWKAFSENSKPLTITEVVVASNAKNPWPPCGFCRQVLAEFCTPETTITLVNTQQKKTTLKFSKLFPLAFDPKYLLK